jgi:hypothetical protein
MVWPIVSHCVCSSAGSHVYSFYQLRKFEAGGRLECWEPRQSAPQWTRSFEQKCGGIALSVEGDRVFVALYDSRIVAFDALNGRQISAAHGSFRSVCADAAGPFARLHPSSARISSTQ